MILDILAEASRERVEAAKRRISMEDMKKMAMEMGSNTGFPFEEALKGSEIQFICEVKKASPSKGIIAEDFPYLDIAREYEEAGAAAVSVLTERDYFLGSPKYLREIAEEVKIPVLRKDFTVDAYQIYEAKVLGASAVLLIGALLEGGLIREYCGLCDSLGLSALVEVHDQEEMETALEAGARVIGVNNRNLKDFTVDITNSIRLRRLAPRDKIFIAESGIRTREDVQKLEEAGVNGVLIGETLMRSADKRKMLEELRGSDDQN